MNSPIQSPRKSPVAVHSSPLMRPSPTVSPRNGRMLNTPLSPKARMLNPAIEVKIVSPCGEVVRECIKTFTEFPITIGRNKMNKLVLNDRYAAGHHAVITHEKSRFSLAHISKTGSTWINDEQLAQDAGISLAKGDILKVGKCFIHILNFKQLPLRPSTLTIKLKHANKIIQIDSQSFYVIGSAHDSNLILLDDSVFPKHAVIFRKEDGFYISNLSPTGIQLFYKADLIQLGLHQEHVLLPGSKLRIANYEFKVLDVKFSA